MLSERQPQFLRSYTTDYGWSHHHLQLLVSFSFHIVPWTIMSVSSNFLASSFASLVGNKLETILSLDLMQASSNFLRVHMLKFRSVNTLHTYIEEFKSDFPLSNIIFEIISTFEFDSLNQVTNFAIQQSLLDFLFIVARILT